jgi:hypothetical protein
VKFAVMGSDPNGRSTVAEAPAAPTQADHGVTIATIWKTENLPPDIVAERRPPDVPAMEVMPFPRGSVWYRTSFPPGYEAVKHRTDTLDYGVVVSGSMHIVSDTGELELVAGDCYMIPGVMHQWRAGPDGVTFTTVLLGLPPV